MLAALLVAGIFSDRSSGFRLRVKLRRTAEAAWRGRSAGPYADGTGLAVLRRRSGRHENTPRSPMSMRPLSRGSASRGNGRRARKHSTRSGTRPGNFQATPLMIGNVLYLSTPYNRVVALNADTGREIWSFDPRPTRTASRRTAPVFVHRGVAAWRTARRQQASHLHEQPVSADLSGRRPRAPGREFRDARHSST